MNFSLPSAMQKIGALPLIDPCILSGMGPSTVNRQL